MGIHLSRLLRYSVLSKGHIDAIEKGSLGSLKHQPYLNLYLRGVKQAYCGIPGGFGDA